MVVRVALYALGCKPRNLIRLRLLPASVRAVVYRAYSCTMSNFTADSETPGPQGGGVQSVDRAISVLEILAQRGEAGVSEVAAELDVHKSTAFRLLGALEARGLVEQAGERGKYCLGFGIVRLAGAVTGRIDITQQGRPVCERLAEEIGETVNIAILEKQFAINLCQVRGPGAITAHNWVGQLTPLHATSSGKILLAHLPAKQRAELLADAGLEKLTPHTLTSKTKLEKNLAEARSAAMPGRWRSWRSACMPWPLRSAPGRRGHRRGQRLRTLLPIHRGADARARTGTGQGRRGDQPPDGLPGLTARRTPGTLGARAAVTPAAGRRGVRVPSRGRRRCGARWAPGHRPWRTGASSSLADSARRRRSPAG